MYTSNEHLYGLGGFFTLATRSMLDMYDNAKRSYVTAAAGVSDSDFRDAIKDRVVMQADLGASAVADRDAGVVWGVPETHGVYDLLPPQQLQRDLQLVRKPVHTDADQRVGPARCPPR
jgi:hypothetical protein